MCAGGYNEFWKYESKRIYTFQTIQFLVTVTRKYDLMDSIKLFLVSCAILAKQFFFSLSTHLVPSLFLICYKMQLRI